MKSIILAVAVVLLSATTAQSQINNAKTETVKVYGNCGMCEATIEKAADKRKISKADWNEETKMAIITYDSIKTTMDAILKNIALAGYDNQSFLAPDEAYNKLPDCCQYDREKKQTAKVTIQPVKDTTIAMQIHNNYIQDGMNTSENGTNQIKAVFENYFALKDALVKTDGNTASTKAKDLQTAISAVKMDQLPMNVHTVWMKVLDELKEDAEHIATNDAKVDHQREHFANLSKKMYELIRVVKPDATVYYQHCPMYDNGKGADWLSKENGIKNPYFGSQMLTCGKTIETIN